MKDFDTFTKIAKKLGQNNWFYRLWKGAQSALNRPIWSHWKGAQSALNRPICSHWKVPKNISSVQKISDLLKVASLWHQRLNIHCINHRDRRSSQRTERSLWPYVVECHVCVASFPSVPMSAYIEQDSNLVSHTATATASDACRDIGYKDTSHGAL